MKNKSVISIILIPLAIIIVDCTSFSGKSSIYKNLNNRKLILSFPLLNKKYASFDYGEKYIMVNYFNGNCSQCIGALKRRNEYIDSLFTNKIELIFIADALDTAALNYLLIDVMHFNKIVLWDENYYFYSFNKEYFANGKRTFLVNSSGDILIVGDPMNDEKVEKEYINLIK